MQKKETVFVGVSGGVDSSVSIVLLQEQGFHVVGCFIKTWQPDFISCTWKEERRDAMRICAQLDVPFLTIDAEEEYKDAVGMYMINEYKAGRTPNPDVMCNKEVKFGVFMKKALTLGADFVATGHYAQTNNGKLFKGIDESKDQSYFLWTLSHEQLLKIKFPVGNLTKHEVRRIADKYNLLTADKKDSQGVCFLGPIDMKDFLKHYIEIHKGNVLTIRGEIIGEHDGALFYTLGERHGFTVTKKGTENTRLYVVERNLSNNTITVSENVDTPSQEPKLRIALTSTNWVTQPKTDTTYTARIRYQQKLELCHWDNEVIVFDNPQNTATSGQSVVLYDEQECIGGGIIV